MKRLPFFKRLAAARAQKQALARNRRRTKTLQFESLDARALLVGDAPTLDVIADVTVKAGSPLIIPLNASDADSGPLTFSAVSNNTTKLTTEAPGANRSLKLVVEGFGEMWFELFEDKAPGVTSKIIEMVQNGTWNNTIFHRVINNFVIQGGDPNGNGLGDDGIPNFDDQYHLDLQHNSTGLLSMAKAGDDTNTSQFFITEGPQRNLDFNHSIFGKLVKGEDVRQAISNVATNASDRPLTDVKITSASIFTDDDNGVLYLKAPTGQTGTVQVTVTVADSDGNTAQRTFNVNIVADDANGSPFLNPIPTAAVTTGGTATIQLSSQDAENDTRVYSAEKIGSVNYTFAINSSTGLLSVTPPSGFVGVMQILVKVRQSTNANANDQFDTQVVNINVRPTAPTLNLLAASDSGVSSSDGITNATGLQFTVGGLTTGSTVKLYRGNDLIETVSAGGASINITTDKFDISTDGTYDVKVTQTVNGVESLFGTYTLKIDRTGPTQIAAGAPTEAIATKPYAYNVEHSEEGTTGFRYSLANAPAGMTINEATGAIAWTPTAAQAGSVTYGIIATDAAGNQSPPRTVNVSVADAPLVQIILRVTDAQGNVITSVENGQSFELRVFTKDLSPENANGVYSAYLDVEFDSTFADVVGAISYGAAYTLLTNGTNTTPGLLDEVGAAQGFTPQGGELLLFKQTFTAKKSGVLTFESNESDSEVLDTLRNPPNTQEFPKSRIDFGTVALSIDATVTAVADTFNVNEDSTNQTLTPLANDTVTVGTTAGLLITGVGATNHGGTVTISQDGKTLIYTPAANYNGAETFTYTVMNTDQSTATGTITVQVQPVNDPPTATNDTFTAAEDVASQFVNVLANDSFAPDSGETLKVKSLGSPSQGGTVALAPNGSGVLYTPKANFVGTETFTYTIDDGNGGEATATVTVTVTNASDLPVAVNDSLTVAEDSSATNFDPLTNDSPGAGDTGETLTITAVGTPSQGGVVTIAADGKTVNYTPKANFFGTETFTYTISDGAGGTATGVVTVTVTNVNDNPTATADAISVGKNQTTTLNLLANDSSAPDPTENLTIESIASISNGGTVTISADKKTVSYTPAAGFTGTETFSYTISDGNGGTATATATITVLDYAPSKISGRVYFDANGDGKKQGAELGIVGIQIRLTGTSPFDADGISQTVTTDAQGRYTFTALPPGSYTIEQATMQGLSNTRYRIGTEGGSNSDGAIHVELGQGVESFYNDFMYDAPRHVGVFSTSLFASASRAGFVASAAPGSSGSTWNTRGEGWGGYTNLKLSLASNLRTVTVTGTDAAGAAKTATIATTNAGRVKAIDRVNGDYVFQVNGTPAQIFGTTSGSGEPGSSTTRRAAGSASGEPGSANLSAFDAALLAVADNSDSERTQNLLAKTRGLQSAPALADLLFASNYR